MGRKRYSSQERTALLEQFANRQQSISRFAKAHGVSVATLYHWQQQLADDGPGAGFVEIQRGVVQGAASVLTLHVGAIALRFEALPDAGYLAALVQKLGR